MKQFFKENNGQSSSTRLIFFLGMIYSMVFVAVWTFGQKPSPGAGEIIAVFSAMTGVFVALKLGQKPMEEKSKEPK